MNKYDIFGISQIINRGLSRKLEIVEKAINKLDPNLEPISILESFAFVANSATAELFRFNYQIIEGAVEFTSPKSFILESEQERTERNTKKTIRKMIEALDENNDEQLSYFKAQWINEERQILDIKKKLNQEVGIRSEYLKNQKKFVTEAVESIRGARSLLKKGKKDSLFAKLIAEGSVSIVDFEPLKLEESEGQSSKRLQYTQIVEARKSAKSLDESPIFNEYIKDLYEGVDVEEAVDIIANEYQELYTLSVSEQVELFYGILESKYNIEPEASKVLESSLTIGKYAMDDEDISQQLLALSEAVGATNGDFHNRMQLIESQINTRTYTENDIKILRSTLEQIVAQPSEFLAPEFVVEARRILSTLNLMVESGNIDDRAIASAIHFVSQFYPTKITESRKGKKVQSGSKEEYQKFFDGKLEKYEVKSPSELSDKEKKKFFDEIDREWKSDDPDDSKKSKKEETDSAEENDNKTIYNESDEGCGQCGSPVCLCKGLSEAQAEDEEVSEETTNEETDIDESEVEYSYDQLVEAHKKLKKSEKSSVEDYEELEQKIKKAKSKNSDDQLEELEDEVMLDKLSAE